jgi:hypothetical protein
VQNIGERAVTLGELVAMPQIVVIGGKPSLQPIAAPHPGRWQIIGFSLEQDEIYDTKGELIPAESAKRRLAPGQVVLLSADGKRVDPFYLQAVQADTLILVTKTASGGLRSE